MVTRDEEVARPDRSIDWGKALMAGLIAPVGRFAADRLGLHDMIGNVWEWTASTYSDDDSRRVARGGSWFCSPDYCSAYRPDFRGKSPAGHAFNNVGFRCARDGEDESLAAFGSR
jgi:formylglycine-generating enzyme required for sulfatase activity